MANPDLIMTLGKVIIAAAWADGEVSPEEVNSLKDLLFRLPQLNARAWASLEMYIETPIGAAERERLVAELSLRLSSQDDKALALAALDEMVAADGVVTDEELAVAEEIKAQIEHLDVGLVGRLGRLMRGPLERRTRAVYQGPNREAQYEEFIKNRVYYVLKERLALEEGKSLDLADVDLRKLSLAGGLMAWVAHVDREVHDQEFSRMVEALAQGWPISENSAAYVAEVAVSQVEAELDYYRLTREFYSCTSRDERLSFLDVLFAVAVADGFVSHEEIEEIRLIARTLKLDHREFIRAKLKIPRDSRSS
jgi:uncharacterized tellurite resistance protein B-like protein